MIDVDSYSVRSELVELLRRELVGPYQIDESLSDNPQRRYIIGQLAPSPPDIDFDDLDESELEYDAESLSVVSESDVVEGGSSVSEAADEGSDAEPQSEGGASIAKARRESLSSVGISFAIPIGARIEYDATWGEYSKNDKNQFVRTGHRTTGIVEFDGPKKLESTQHGRVAIKWVARSVRGELIASLFMVNSASSAFRDGTERIYQVALQLSVSNSDRGFLSRDQLIGSGKSQAATATELLYQDRKEFGVGLHTAVEAVVVDGRCSQLTTTVMPATETFNTVSREFTNYSEALGMPWLARTESRTEVCAALRHLFIGYLEWPDELRSLAAELDNRFSSVAEVQIEKIRERVRRLLEGIATLENDDRAFAAFKFANEVMARSQFRASQKARYRIGDEIDVRGASGAWKPFQLAFLLSTLVDIVEPNRVDRKIVDVLFFPTGGGKTEAYLGLSAFAMGYRRFSGKAAQGGAGISTLMRYTLRLLTTQQFVRAATMICAAELARREGLFEGRLGASPFSIGLWVGPMTPSTFSGAADALKRARAEHFSCSRSCDLSRSMASNIGSSTGMRAEPIGVLPITECPWCFTPLCVECVGLDEAAERVVVVCPNAACSFSHDYGESEPALDGLPLAFVDSDVYKLCPSIVIATVDKFATLPFRGEAKALFGAVSRSCEICGFLTDCTEHKGHKGQVRALSGLAPCDLVVQDELHTITDNLGSIYGLYETAIEFLISERGSAPKYVCATATVKDVETQIRRLYGNRSCSVFPPTGLKVGDTYFSSDVKASRESPGRQYVGIYAPTFSRLSTFVAVLSSFMALAWKARVEHGIGVADPYLTLLGYFNTIRDLGGVKSLLGDDVQPEINQIADRNGWQPRKLVQWQEELTGRITSSEVPARLKTLETAYVDGIGCDFMAATNMISVGVDVPRLGAMLVDGQPKTTAEYIQATSRVGRKHPGVVIVVYNAMRPRDVSHYEHFFAYHDSFYKFVEAGSITPFSDGVIDRYLRSAFVASFRLSSSASDNDAAERYLTDPEALNSRIVKAFANRAECFSAHERRSVRIALEDVQARWSTAPKAVKYVLYKPRFEPRRGALTPRVTRKTVIKPTGEARDETIDALFAAPQSMRNVEAEIPLKIGVDG